MNKPARHFLPDWLSRLLQASAMHRYYPLVVGLIAFVSVATFSFPFAAVLIPAVLLAPTRWRWIGLLSGIASGFGAGVLVEVFQYLGLELITARYPDLVRHEAWQAIRDWLQHYGLFAMLVIAASPMPQTPAVLFLALADASVFGVMLAVGVGKTVKYLFLAWATAHYPARYARFR